MTLPKRFSLANILPILFFGKRYKPRGKNGTSISFASLILGWIWRYPSNRINLSSWYLDWLVVVGGYGNAPLGLKDCGSFVWHRILLLCGRLARRLDSAIS